MCRDIEARIAFVKETGAMIGEHITMTGDRIDRDHAIVERVVTSAAPIGYDGGIRKGNAAPAPQCDWPHDSQAFWDWLESDY